jgi:hypothetical protein
MVQNEHSIYNGIRRMKVYVIWVLKTDYTFVTFHLVCCLRGLAQNCRDEILLTMATLRKGKPKIASKGTFRY